MLYRVKITFQRKSSNEIVNYNLTACSLNACKFEAVKYLMSESIKVMSITFTEEE